MQYENITLWIIESFNIFSDLYLSNEGWIWNTMYEEAPLHFSELSQKHNI